ncbi:MAG: membrane biogenesis protein [Oscillospiraceae bacterium]|nr:membrane biogenesis protein [Oscillospiraceae bacterium]MCR5806400.1 membrane biogenesis protein [Oscillospiraceae bacterium]
MREEKVKTVFHQRKPVIAMIHLNGEGKAQVQERAKREIEQLYSCGADALLAENYFGSVDDVEWALDYLHTNYPEHIYGVNLLGDYETGFVLAENYGGKIIQIDSVCGHLPVGPDANNITQDGGFEKHLRRLRSRYPIFLMGGVRFKYQPVRSGRSAKEDLLLGKERCDAVVVTGAKTAVKTDMAKILSFREILGDSPLFVGAGMTADNCREQLSVADGAIVGSWFKVDGVTGNPVDPERVRMFMDVVREIRAEGSDG